MKKTLNINLGGHPLTIDEDAYDLLNSYIQKLEKRFSLSSGSTEIIEDIESQMGEILSERTVDRKIVNVDDVEFVIESLGQPVDFDSTRKETPNFQPGKKLFKDPENKRVAGVCAGLACYFGIDDPLWVRLGFVGLVFLGIGFPIIMYIALWAVLPNAITPHDKLNMKGEPINIESIAKSVEDEINCFSDDLKKSWSKK